MEGLFIVCLSMCACIQTSIWRISCVPSRFGVLHFHFLTHLALIFSPIFYPNREVPKLIIVVRCVSKPLHKKTLQRINTKVPTIIIRAYRGGVCFQRSLFVLYTTGLVKYLFSFSDVSSCVMRWATRSSSSSEKGEHSPQNCSRNQRWISSNFNRIVRVIEQSASSKQAAKRSRVPSHLVSFPSQAAVQWVKWWSALSASVVATRLPEIE